MLCYSRLLRSLINSDIIKVNGQKILVSSGLPVIKALEKAGIVLTRYCYSERLGVVGNCRSCLIEVKGQSKAGLGCVEVVKGGMELFTNSGLVVKRKEGILEFLLRNHPLDCPVCDQGGECDLQEGSVGVGVIRGRVFEGYRREVVIKDFCFRLSSSMRKCILCSRCIRFDNKGDSLLSIGLLGRSESSEVSNYTDFLKSNFDNGVLGNVIDLCPVGLVISE